MEPASLRGTQCLESFLQIKTEKLPYFFPLQLLSSRQGKGIAKPRGEEVPGLSNPLPSLRPYPPDPLLKLQSPHCSFCLSFPAHQRSLPKHTQTHIYFFGGQNAKQHYFPSPWYCHESCLVCLPEKWKVFVNIASPSTAAPPFVEMDLKRKRRIPKWNLIGKTKGKYKATGPGTGDQGLCFWEPTCL